MPAEMSYIGLDNLHRLLNTQYLWGASHGLRLRQIQGLMDNNS